MLGNLTMMSRKIFYLVIISVFLFDCRSGNENKNAVYKPSSSDMADLNSYLIQKDRERIQSYFERKGLAMTETSTGLWYSILNEGTGDFFKESDVVRYEYDCTLLDGTNCYNSQAQIRLGRSELPMGLYEGLKLLKKGGEAILILPPFLAYGFVGDGKKIPPRATLVYSIRVLE
jgi:FKBP-type peptidyl-prolyl cis-trans isomerase